VFHEGGDCGRLGGRKGVGVHCNREFLVHIGGLGPYRDSRHSRRQVGGIKCLGWPCSVYIRSRNVVFIEQWDSICAHFVGSFEGAC
jgi:hypothetical protein